jgi:hypothetical protein
VHATPGLWHPEWTSHGPFFEKIKDRLVQPIAPGGAAGPVIRPFLCAYSTQALAQAPARGRTTPVRVDERVLVELSHTGSLYPASVFRLPLPVRKELGSLVVRFSRVCFTSETRLLFHA